MKNCKKIKTCLACGNKNIKKILDLKKQPLANNFSKTKYKFDQEYPLIVNVCPKCIHLQLGHCVDPKLIYKNYIYVTNNTQSYKNYLKNFSISCITKFKKNKPKTVLDIGCNDGAQLNYFKILGMETYGIDPAKNLFSISSRKHKIICDFINKKSINKIKKKIDIILAQNSFAHNPKPYQTLKVIKQAMHSESLLFIQTSQADMIKNNEFDTVYHEHINFFNTKSMHLLAERAGFSLLDVYKTKVHGSTYVFVLKIKTQTQQMLNTKIKKTIKTERFLNLNKCKKWSLNAQKIKKRLIAEIAKARKTSQKIIGYGASAKGNTLLNFSKINLDYIVDDNPLKQNTFTPGMRIPVKSRKSLTTLKKNKKVTFLLLVWSNIYKEIRIKIKKTRNSKKDRFISFFPKVVTLK
jgi:SAM-dependent methyltransferase